MATQRTGATGCRGLTLIELMIGLAIAVLLMSLALPSLFGALQRQRLKGAAEDLALDLTEARFEAAARGVPVNFTFTTGPDWCWGISAQSSCDCRVRQPCLVKAVRAADRRSVALVEGRGSTFMPDRAGSTLGSMAVLQTPGGDRLKVELSGMGRARICAPDGGMPQFPAC